MTPLSENPLYALSQDCFNYCLTFARPRAAIDIGANDGGYTNTMLQAGFRVTAIEPVPDMFAILRNRYLGNPFVECLNMAISDKTGVLENVTVLCAWTLGTPESLPLSVCPSYVSKPRFNVVVQTLDTMKWPDGVGIIKLDVDGYEARALRGARMMLELFRPPILCEFSRYVRDVGDTFQGFLETIFSLGYHVFSMDGKRRFTDWPSIEPHYPDDTSFDVMLIHETLSDAILLKFK